MRSSGVGGRQAGNRVMRAVRVIVRARNTEATYGSLFPEPERVEDDYNRFVKQPRD